MTEQIVLYREQDRVAMVTLNATGDGNAIDAELAQTLLGVCGRINENDEVHVVILTASGGVFCGGSRLEQTVRSGQSLQTAVNRLGDDAVRYEVASALAMIDRPVIAAMNGDALGQGLELALACDVRIAVEGARLGFPDVASGLMPMDGGTQRLPRLIGKGKALELILGGQPIDAREALGLGLVSQVIPPAELMAVAMAMAQGMATKAPIALRYVKEAVNKGMDLTLDQGVRLEADLYFLIHTTEDRTEGIQAFQQKRKPQFKGK
jgi:enoyl-CoA hydratase/carnithine racemase